METAQHSTVPNDSPAQRSFTTEAPIMLGDKELIAKGTRIHVRKPGSGELRGLQLQSLFQLDVLQLESLAPRITTPMIHKGATMDPADLMQFGAEVLDFLLPQAAKPDFPQA
jgi:hypothetical protein